MKTVILKPGAAKTKQDSSLYEDGDLRFRLRGGHWYISMCRFAESDPGTPEIAGYKVDE